MKKNSLIFFQDLFHESAWKNSGGQQYSSKQKLKTIQDELNLALFLYDQAISMGSDRVAIR